MVLPLLESVDMSDARVEHLQAAEIAAFADGAVSGAERAAVVAHLADCAECRAEVAEVQRITGGISGARRRWATRWIPAAAAAAAALLLITRPDARRVPESEHREAPIATTIAPRAIEPRATVDSLVTLRWSSVPSTDRYVVRVFDAGGTVVWEATTIDTIAAVPASVRLLVSRPYHWKVEAFTGVGRSTSSELIEFSIRRARAP